MLKYFVRVGPYEIARLVSGEGGGVWQMGSKEREVLPCCVRQLSSLPKMSYNLFTNFILEAAFTG